MTLASLARSPSTSDVKLETRYIPFSIELAGIRWSGDWSLVDGVLKVGSAYGWANRPLRRRRPDLLAREMLVEILRAKLAECEAKRRKLSRAAYAIRCSG